MLVPFASHYSYYSTFNNIFYCFVLCVSVYRFRIHCASHFIKMMHIRNICVQIPNKLAGTRHSPTNSTEYWCFAINPLPYHSIFVYLFLSVSMFLFDRSILLSTVLVIVKFFFSFCVFLFIPAMRIVFSCYY